MKNSLMEIPDVFQKWIDDPRTELPVALAKVLVPFTEELGTLQVIHPTTNDPVILSEKFGAIALWFRF